MSDPVDLASFARKFSQPLMAQRPQDWASHTLAASHEDAIGTFGEFAIFTLMWRPTDFRDGLVGHCTTCFAGARSRQAEAFQQPEKRNCPDCFGTTFEGGYRAQIIRPVIVSDRATVVAEGKEGTTETDTIQFETTGDFSFTLGDYLTRFDNTRYQVETKTEVVVQTGFEPSIKAESLNSMAIAHLEEETSVAHMIPPTDPVVVAALLSKQGPFYIQDIEQMNITIRVPHGYLLEP
jgi:hypothetical protein